MFYPITIAISLLFLCFIGCTTDINIDNPPLDRPYYPAALAQNGDFLSITSTNFNGRYRSGAVHTADLKEIDNVSNASVGVAGAYINSHTTALRYFDTVLVGLSRSTNSLSYLHAEGKNLGAISTINLDRFEPKHLIEVPNLSKKYGLVGYVYGVKIHPFVVDTINKRVVLNTDEAVHLDQLLLDTDETASEETLRMFNLNDIQYVQIEGVNYICLLATKAKKKSVADDKGWKKLIFFEAALLENPTQITKDKLLEIDISKQSTARNIAFLHFYQHNAKVFLMVVEHMPDAIVQYEIAMKAGKMTATPLRYSGTCKNPVTVQIDEPFGYGMVACSDDDTVEVFDLDTLQKTSKNTGFGRSPFGMQLDTREARKINSRRLYVAYHGDGSLGVFDIDDKGRLSVLRRVFSASPMHTEGGI